MTIRTSGYGLFAVGLFMGFFRITTDPLFLTLISFSVAVAGALLIARPYRLRWLVVVFLAPAAAFGILSLVLTHRHIFLSIAWIGAAVFPILQVFTETRAQQASVSNHATDVNDRNA
jgi:hypothetical protein